MEQTRGRDAPKPMSLRPNGQCLATSPEPTTRTKSIYFQRGELDTARPHRANQKGVLLLKRSDRLLSSFSPGRGCAAVRGQPGMPMLGQRDVCLSGLRCRHSERSQESETSQRESFEPGSKMTPTLPSTSHLVLFAPNTHCLSGVDNRLNDVRDPSFRDIVASSGVTHRVLSLRLYPLRAQRSLCNVESTSCGPMCVAKVGRLYQGVPAS